MKKLIVLSFSIFFAFMLKAQNEFMDIVGRILETVKKTRNEVAERIARLEAKIDKYIGSNEDKE